VYRLASDNHQAEVGLQQVVLGPDAILGDPLQVDARVRGQVLALGQLLLGEQARLDPLGQLDLLLGVEQRHLADLLQVVLDRVRGGARHRDLRGREIVVVIAEDENLLVLAGAVRCDLDDGARDDGALGDDDNLRGRLVRLGLVRSFLAFPAVLVHGQAASQVIASQIDCAGDVLAEVGLVQVLAGECGLEVRFVGQVRVVGVDIAEVVEICVGVKIGLVEIHRGQALGR